MSQHRFWIALCLGSTALMPIAAYARDGNSGADSRAIAGKLSDPGNQVAATVALTAMSEALLDLSIAPLVRALRTADPQAGEGLPPDARLRDLAGPDADRVPKELGRRVPEVMGTAAGLANAVQDMMPQLRAMGDRLKDALPDR